MNALHRPLDVLRVVVESAQDDQILQAAGDEELTKSSKKAEVAGPQPAGRIAVDLRRKGLACGNLVSPVAFRDMRTADPDLADLVGAQPIKVFGIDDGNSFAHDRAPAADEDLQIRLFGRRTHAAVAKLRPADRPRSRDRRRTRPARDHDGCLSHTVERIHGTRVEAIRRKRAVEPIDRVDMDRFGPLRRPSTTSRSSPSAASRLKTAHTQIETQNRHAGDLAADPPG